MITLHESSITSFPLDNGIGVLRDVIRAYAEEELNGMFEFYMEYDSEGHLVDELKEERIIKAKAQDKLGYQLFRIYSITKNHENDNLIVQAQHITYDLANNFVESLEARNLTKKQVMELIGSSTVLPHPFNVTSSNTTTISSTSLYRTNPLQMIGGIEGSVLQIWGGQIERDNFNLILHDRRGSDDGVKVTYEKNITGLEATFDISGLVTRIFPFVYIEATDDEPERLITVSGKYIDSPHINDYEKIYIEPVDYSNDERINTDGTDAQIRQQLTNIASQYFTETGNDKIKVDMEVQFEHLWETEEYKDLAVLELVGMGDTVTINHSKLKVDATAIVNYIRYDCIAEKNEEVRLGSVKARLTDNVNRVVDVAEKVEQAQQTANQAIRAANGKNTIYYGPDEPEGGIEGDLWFRVVDGEYTRTYRHDGIQWQLVLSVDVRDAMDEAQQAKDEAQSAVDRANQATQQATDAINQAQTAFDEAQQALGTASNALTQATSAFNLANDAFSEVESLSEMVDENTGEISTIKQSVTGLQTQVNDNAGNISSLTQIAQGLQTQVTDIEGNVSTLQQTAQGLQSSVTNLRDEFDNLEIGGRNLIRGTSSEFKEIILPANRWNTAVIGQIFVGGDNPLQVGDNAVVRAYIKSGNYRTAILLNLYDENDSRLQQITSNYIPAEQEGYAIRQFIVRSNTVRIDIMLRHDNNTYPADTKYYKELKLEKGNKATDWTPAPEDIDYQFSEITQTIDSITTRVGDAEGNITALQQTSSSLAARLTDAEGNITTLTATVNGLQTTVSNVQGDVSSVTQLANALQVRMTDAEGNISTLTQTASSLQSTVSSLQDEWDNLEIGGRNYHTNTTNEFREATWNDWNYYPNGYNYIIPVAPGEYYTARVYYKDVWTDNGVHVGLRIFWWLENGSRLESSNSETSIAPGEEGYVSITRKAPDNAVGATVVLRKFSGSGTTGRAKYKELKLEKGTVATDWSPAPEDMATQSQITQLSDAINLRVEKGDVINQINISTESILIDGRRVHITGQTTIDNGVIKSAHIQSLDAGKITSGTLDAGKISVINLSANSIVGGVLQSQNSNTTFNLNTGELYLENNNITFGNSANIDFTSTGNRLTYRYTSGITRSSGLGVGLALGGEYPYAFLGTTGAPDLDTLSQWFSGFIANTTARIAEGGANSVTGNRFQFRNTAVGFDKVIEVDFFGSRPYIAPLYPASYNHDLGTENRPWDRLYVNYMRVIGDFSIRNRNNNAQGWRMETSSQASDRGIAFYPLDPAQRNYDIGRSTHRINWIYLKNNPSVSSDERLKEDITSVDLGLDFIRDLELNSFRLKATTADVNQGLTRNKKQYGIIAQQLRDTLVNHGVDVDDITMIDNAEDGMYSVQYEQLIPIALKGIQELDLKVESVKDDVEWLKLENQYLKQKIKQLEEKIA